MSQATQAVLDALNEKIGTVNVSINQALVAGQATAPLRKKLQELQGDLSAARARHETAQADAHAAALRTAEDDAAALVLAANAEVNDALQAIGTDLRLADDDQRFAAAARCVTFAQLAVDAVVSKFHEANAKFDQVHEQLAKVSAKHDELLALRQGGDTSDKTAAQLYACSLDRAALQGLADSAPVAGNAVTERAFLVNAQADFAKQKSNAIIGLAREDIARVEDLFIARVRGLDNFARSNRLINGGSIFSVIKPGEKISYMMRTGSLPSA
ncbi:hypothetical protein B0G80_4406 [Paraburkholderia sp. BL6669N2]|uniref:hypothetical protein n=1 Tax=Paraburkholderia sp. BL6669N2 TaxID=1938807 RepID=UPI000E2361B2|nr:hypothetical protein [Paraburkholderia sp. BL6669N2]REG61553.1 hypothetical protein B0G80_4406 [Paraburkholderia sp. BL6669N2]